MIVKNHPTSLLKSDICWPTPSFFSLWENIAVCQQVNMVFLCCYFPNQWPWPSLQSIIFVNWYFLFNFHYRISLHLHTVNPRTLCLTPEQLSIIFLLIQSLWSLCFHKESLVFTNDWIVWSTGLVSSVNILTPPPAFFLLYLIVKENNKKKKILKYYWISFLHSKITRRTGII